jgi:xylulose-5-phosphate/fructose-6-phosphate phosphoketolase
MAVLSVPERKLINAYWRAANYLTLGQIYLLENPLLKERLTPDHIKQRLLGHCGNWPGASIAITSGEL